MFFAISAASSIYYSFLITLLSSSTSIFTLMNLIFTYKEFLARCTCSSSVDLLSNLSGTHDRIKRLHKARSFLSQVADRHTSNILKETSIFLREGWRSCEESCHIPTIKFTKYFLAKQEQVIKKLPIRTKLINVFLPFW